MTIRMDYETRSKADLKTVGAYNYSRHESTEVICVAYSIDDGPIVISHPSYPGLAAVNWPPKDLLTAIERGDLLHAHNSSFEKYITKFVCGPKYSWPIPDDDNWRCSLSVCAYRALPRSLEEASKALGLAERKDTLGKKIMMRCSLPRSDGGWHEDTNDLLTTFEYCKQDVAVERAIEKRLGQLPPFELKVWLLDQRMNERGILFDVGFANTAIHLASGERAKANIAIYELTKGKVKSTGGRKDFSDWSKTVGYDMSKVSLAADKIPAIMNNPDVPDIIKHAVKIKTSVSNSSLAKFQKAIEYASPYDHRIRDTLAYGGAATLRWAGRGVQIQNFPKGYGANMKEIVDAIVAKDHQWPQLLTGDSLMDLLKKSTRGMICASPGRELLVSDLSAIEARVIMWLCEEEEGLAAIKTSCIYSEMASTIYGYAVKKATHPTERGLGKVVILAAGFGMGYLKFHMQMEKDGIFLSDALVFKLLGDRYQEYRKQVVSNHPKIKELKIDLKTRINALVGAKFLIDMYQAKFPKIKASWRNFEDVARMAIKNPDQEFPVTRVVYYYDSSLDILECRLPSGHAISFPQPRLTPSYSLVFSAKNKKGKPVKIRTQKDLLDGNERASMLEHLKGKEFTLDEGEPEVWLSEKISYMRAEKGGFRRGSTYGASLVQSAVQGIARDIIAEGSLRAEQKGMELIGLVHDEIIAEADSGKFTYVDLEHAMCEIPDWAEGMPIAAEGFTCQRYHK